MRAVYLSVLQTAVGQAGKVEMKATYLSILQTAAGQAGEGRAASSGAGGVHQVWGGGHRGVAGLGQGLSALWRLCWCQGQAGPLPQGTGVLCEERVCVQQYCVLSECWDRDYRQMAGLQCGDFAATGCKLAHCCKVWRGYEGRCCYNDVTTVGWRLGASGWPEPVCRVDVLLALCVVAMSQQWADLWQGLVAGLGLSAEWMYC